MDRTVELDELVEHWTLLDDELKLVAGKRGVTRLGFALLLKFFVRHTRFPRGRAELPDAVVRFVAGQVGVDASELGLYDWLGRTVEFHRAQIRGHMGFRECSVSDAEKLALWLAAETAGSERDPAVARDQLASLRHSGRRRPARRGSVVGGGGPSCAVGTIDP